jgi:hypothetical protein
MTPKDLNLAFVEYETTPTKLISYVEDLGINADGLHTSISLHRNKRQRLNRNWQITYCLYFKLLDLYRKGVISKDQFYEPIKII